MLSIKHLTATLLLFLLASCMEPNTKADAHFVIRGQVVGKSGPEAGVWVIAETDDLASAYTKIVVTDNKGKFVLPEMPTATYRIWVRGYGLKDSATVRGQPGDTLILNAEYPASPQQAAQVYPASYWYSLAEPPPAHEFPGTGQNGNGIEPRMASQEAWIDAMKQQCQLCHQLGTKITRELTHLDKTFASSEEAWRYRLSKGVSAGGMNRHAALTGYQQMITMYANWTDRIANGEVPPPPPRPQGIERNLVITMWDWGDETTAMVHDEITTDKRKPHINAKGPIYGVAQFDGELLITDPLTHTSKILAVPMRTAEGNKPVNLGGTDSHNPRGSSDAHNHMLDSKGRVWMTSRVRQVRDTPTWCQSESQHPSATYFPLSRSSRQASYYDPASDTFQLIDTCYTTHHLQFASDANDTLWFSGDKQVIGWINTRMFDQTGDEQLSQGWCPTVLDTNGDGQITRPWNEPGEVINPKRDTRIEATRRLGDGVVNQYIANFYYGIIPNPVDKSVWLANPGPTPGALLRVTPGNNPPETCKTEIYEPPFDNGITPRKEWGYAPRGVDVDSQGVIWTALSGSAQLASFDRRKCKVTKGPTATGQHCPEGWTLYPSPGPKMKGIDAAGGADFHYYNWVDQFNTLGLGKDTPIATGTSSDSLLALNPDTGKWVVMRVPYPMGFYTRGLDGRIDDPKAGWKGSALYANYGGFPTWHQESTKAGKNTRAKVVKFQIRPDPLAD